MTRLRVSQFCARGYTAKTIRNISRALATAVGLAVSAGIASGGSEPIEPPTPFSFKEHIR